MKIKRKSADSKEAILVTHENVKFVSAMVNIAWGVVGSLACVGIGDVVTLSEGGEVVDVIAAQTFSEEWEVVKTKSPGRPKGSKAKEKAAEEKDERQLEIG